jgi:hypothetical protein
MAGLGMSGGPDGIGGTKIRTCWMNGLRTARTHSSFGVTPMSPGMTTWAAQKIGTMCSTVLDGDARQM